MYSFPSSSSQGAVTVPRRKRIPQLDAERAERLEKFKATLPPPPQDVQHAMNELKRIDQEIETEINELNYTKEDFKFTSTKQRCQALTATIRGKEEIIESLRMSKGGFRSIVKSYQNSIVQGISCDEEVKRIDAILEKAKQDFDRLQKEAEQQTEAIVSSMTKYGDY